MPDATNFLSAQTWETLVARGLLFIPQLVTGIIILGLFWLLGTGFQRAAIRLGESRGHADLASLLGRSVKITLLLFGTITALGTLGIDITALVAGLGITGFALSFALKDIISNALAGIMVIVYQPFQRNDHITVTGIEGRVVEINLRYTVLDTPERKAYVPNASLFTNAVLVNQPASIRQPTDDMFLAVGGRR